eukprot:c15652_g1_i1.p1 GENE.c15652_g1_i1~~c15652_g1_i1.p1  ORF type:complete len:564 (-),score=132.15 c15652_g1_i1:140-1831(-)
MELSGQIRTLVTQGDEAYISGDTAKALSQYTQAIDLLRTQFSPAANPQLTRSLLSVAQVYHDKASICARILHRDPPPPIDPIFPEYSPRITSSSPSTTTLTLDKDSNSSLGGIRVERASDEDATTYMRRVVDAVKKKVAANAPHRERVLPENSKEVLQQQRAELQRRKQYYDALADQSRDKKDESTRAREVHQRTTTALQLTQSLIGARDEINKNSSERSFDDFGIRETHAKLQQAIHQFHKTLRAISSQHRKHHPSPNPSSSSAATTTTKSTTHPRTPISLPPSVVPKHSPESKSKISSDSPTTNSNSTSTKSSRSSDANSGAVRQPLGAQKLDESFLMVSQAASGAPVEHRISSPSVDSNSSSSSSPSPPSPAVAATALTSATGHVTQIVPPPPLNMGEPYLMVADAQSSKPAMPPPVRKAQSPKAVMNLVPKDVNSGIGGNSNSSISSNSVPSSAKIHHAPVSMPSDPAIANAEFMKMAKVLMMLKEENMQLKAKCKQITDTNIALERSVNVLDKEISKQARVWEEEVRRFEKRAQDLARLERAANLTLSELQECIGNHK